MVVISDEHNLNQELTSDCSGDESEEDGSSNKVNDKDTVVTDDNNVEVEDKESLLSANESNDHDGDDDEDLDPLSV